MLRRAQSHGSLLDRESDYDNSKNEFRRPNGDGRSGSYANLDDRMERNRWGGSHQAGLNGNLEKENLRGISNYYESSDAVRLPQDRRSKSGGSRSAGQAGGVGGSSRGRTPPGANAGSGPNATVSVLASAQLVPSNEYAPPPSSSPASAYNRPSRGFGSVPKIAAVPSSGLKNDWTAVDAHVSGVST